MDMMKNGELKASKILPLVAKYYAEAARKGGALTKAQQSNRVAMQRLQQTWMNFQNKIFESGFGDELTKTFNDLSHMLDAKGPLAEKVGQFTSGFIKGFMDIAHTISNVCIFINAELNMYIPQWIKKSETFQKATNWVGWGLGALFFAASLVRVFRILAKIAGITGTLKILKEIFGGPDVPKSGGGNSGGNGPWDRKGGGKRSGVFGKLLGWSIRNPYVAAALMGYDYVNSNDSEKNAKKQDLGNAYSFGGGDLMAVTGGMLSSWWTSLWAGHMQDKANYLQSHNLMPGGSTAGQIVAPMVIPTEPVSGEITIKIDAGELRNMIDQQIETANMDNINLILAVPQ
ncbi:hypothetical protein KQM40_003747 [Escherichia coli]|nr:hypothetical protein [Escherichia coli]